jgi:hypothetical protein
MNKFRDLGFVSYRGSSIEVHGALLSVLLNDKPQPHKKSPFPGIVARKCPASKRG